MRYSPKQIEFYATLGHAITTWAHVEQSLFMVYFRAIGSPYSHSPSAAFFSIINFNAKLTMVDSVMTFRYQSYPDVLERWANIRNKLGKRAKRRNELAHWQLLIDATDGSYTHRLTPHLFDPNPFKGGKERPFHTVSDIYEVDLKFRQSMKELDELAEDLEKTQRPEFPEQEDDQPNSQSPDGQTP